MNQWVSLIRFYFGEGFAALTVCQFMRRAMKKPGLQWRFGTVAGWTGAVDTCGSTEDSLLEALGHSYDGMSFIFVYEDGHLLGCKDIKAFLRSFGMYYYSHLDPNDAAYMSAWRRADKHKDPVAWRQLTQKLEAEVLEMLKEQTNEHRN